MTMSRDRTAQEQQMKSCICMLARAPRCILLFWSWFNYLFYPIVDCHQFWPNWLLCILSPFCWDSLWSQQQQQQRDDDERRNLTALFLFIGLLKHTVTACYVQQHCLLLLLIVLLLYCQFRFQFWVKRKSFDNCVVVFTYLAWITHVQVLMTKRDTIVRVIGEYKVETN